MFQPLTDGARQAAEIGLSRHAWLRRCAPLLAFLATPRTSGQLRDWASGRAMSSSRLDGMLRWLRDDGLLLDVGRGTKWMRT